jgi:HK97 family phage major capsid protein
MVDRLLNSGRPRAFAGEAIKAARAGRWVMATLGKDAKSLDWCLTNGVTVERSAGETTGPAGGFTVPAFVEDEIIELRALAGTFRAEARVRPMGGDSLTVPKRTGGLTAYFVGENSEITESTASWSNIGLAAKKLAALSRLSTELAEDAVAALGQYFTEEMAFGFADKEDDCGWNGDGTSTYGGIVGIRTKIIDGEHNASKVAAASTHDTFAEIDATDINALMAALPARYWQTAKFHCSAYAAAITFARLGATTAGLVMTAAGPRPMLTYAGFPIVMSSRLPGAGDQSGAVMITFGDLHAASELGERRGVTVDASQHRFFEVDQIAIRGTERFDIVNHGLGDNTTAGALVGLVGD